MLPLSLSLLAESLLVWLAPFECFQKLIETHGSTPADCRISPLQLRLWSLAIGLRLQMCVIFRWFRGLKSSPSGDSFGTDSVLSPSLRIEASLN
jgi:hypothetical protein